MNASPTAQRLLREELDPKRQYSDLLRGLARGDVAPPEFHGEAARVVPLNAAPLTLGSDRANDVVLHDELIAGRHATIEPWPEGFAVHDAHSRTGTYVNGRAVIWSGLCPGDLVQLGPYLFHYQKTHLLWLRQPAAFTLCGVGLRRYAGAQLLLDDVSVVARPGDFVGLLGPSGAGKTTLLNALSGLVPAQRGQVLINGESLNDQPDRWRHWIGYVPQEDIVHPELTIRQAFSYAARLRLPARASTEERHAMMDKVLSLLELDERADLPIYKLSGGQRKRVSVGVELLGRPRLLFLDEPTSGLDPSTEAKLMGTLRELAHQGRTVLCTTHIMENVELFDRIAVLAVGGKLAYFGPPDEALEYFEVDRFSKIYDRLDNLPSPSVSEDEKPASNPSAEWQRHFFESPHGWRLRQDVAAQRQPRPFHQQDRRQPSDRVADIPQAWLLACRFVRVIGASGKTPLLLVAQPLIIGGLIGAVFHEVRPLMFLLVLATLWFGCSLSAQQIVKERAIVRRERRIRHDWLPYVASKFVPLLLLTFGQALAMWALVGNMRSLPGELRWQVLSLLLVAANGVAFGLVISALSASADSATSAVPLTLIPQIALAGLLLPIADMNWATKAASDLMPARWSFHLMEAAWLQDRRADADLLRSWQTAQALANLETDYDFKDIEGRKRFLDDRKDQTLDFHHGVAVGALVLSCLCLVQLLGLTAYLSMFE